MKRTLSVLLALAMTICMLTTTAMVTSAAETDTQSGIEATLVTDKDAYSSGEDIKVTVNVKNTNTYDVTGVSITVELPEGLTLKSGDLSISDVDIAAGETYSKEVVAVKETSTPPTDNPTDTPTDKPTEKPADTPTDKPTTENPSTGNNGNGNANSPQTGDSSNMVLWVALMAVSAAGIFLTVKFRKKATKFLSLFLCVVMVCTIVPTGAFAAEADNDTVSITVDKTITVDGDEYILKSNINLSNSQEVVLSNFNADETYFICGEESTITFTVDAVGNPDEIELCKNENETVGLMHDDGLNGDLIANDGTYTYVVTDTVNSDSTILVDYHSKTSNVQSEKLTLYYIANKDIAATDELIQEIDKHIAEIEQKFYQSESDDEKTNVAINIFNNIIQYIDLLKKEGKILYYVIEDNTITIRLLASTYVYTFDLSDNHQEKNSSNAINSTYSAIENNSTYTHNILSAQPASDLTSDVFDNAAQLIENRLSGYNFLTNADNDSVSIDFLKHLDAYKVIIWDGHGGYTPELHSIICTGESSIDATSKYSTDMIGRNPAIVPMSGGTLGVTHEFFEKYYKDSPFNDTIIYFGCCHGAEDDVLANVLIDCGVRTVFGYRYSVYSGYNRNMCATIFATMVENDGNNSITKSAITAYEEAKRVNGETDPTKQHWWNKVSDFFGWTQHETPAELRILGDGDYRFKHEGTLSGKICKASDRSTAISGATINVYQNNNLYTTQTADATGNYSIDLPAGQYYIEITAEGYIDFHSYATVTEGENTYMETFLMVEGSEDETGVASGRVVNSLTGTGIDSVTLTVRKDWNNLNESAETVATTTTGSNGNYSMELPLGNYTVVASKDGYITSSFNIIVQSGTTDNQNGTIVPVVSGDEFLITLTWGENPRDLDSHVEGKLTNGDPFHVYFRHKSQYDGNVEVCNLDYDDINSYGPEHITLKVTTNEPYYYYIYKYAGSGTVAASRAKITVHQGNALIAEYNVPTNLGGDDYWNVFAIKDGQLITKNTITSSADTSYAD